MKSYNEYIEQLIRLAEEAIWEGNYEQGKKLLDTGLIEEPGYPKLHYTLGWMYQFYRENKSLSERHYLLSVYFDPDYMPAYEGLSALYLSGKKWKKLKALMDKAGASEEVDSGFVYETLGKVSEKEGRFREAIGYYKKAMLSCMDNCHLTELKQNIKRSRFKRFTTCLRRKRV